VAGRASAFSLLGVTVRAWPARFVLLAFRPALRARRDDIVPLAATFLERAARQLRERIPRLSEQAANALTRHDWPRNAANWRGSWSEPSSMRTAPLGSTSSTCACPDTSNPRCPWTPPLVSWTESPRVTGEAHSGRWYEACEGRWVSAAGVRRVRKRPPVWPRTEEFSTDFRTCIWDRDGGRWCRHEVRVEMPPRRRLTRTASRDGCGHRSGRGRSTPNIMGCCVINSS